MTVNSDTFLTFAAIGNREDLMDKIFMNDPVETPFTAMCKVSTATAKLHEWQTQALAAAAENAQVEGAVFVNTARTVTARVRNNCQISDKVIEVSMSQQATTAAGRNKEMAYQTALAAQELKRDIEYICLQNGIPTVGSSSVARHIRPMLSWYRTNVNMNSGTNGTRTTARTDGTPHALTETIFSRLLQTLWTNRNTRKGTIIAGASQRANITTFDFGATRQTDTAEKKVTNRIKVLDTDWGLYSVIASRQARASDIHVLNRDYLALAYLRKVKTDDVAKVADSIRGSMVVEWTLEVRNEKAHGLITDLS